LVLGLLCVFVPLCENVFDFDFINITTV